MQVPGRRGWNGSKRIESSHIVAGCLYNEFISVKLGHFLIVKKQLYLEGPREEKKKKGKNPVFRNSWKPFAASSLVFSHDLPLLRSHLLCVFPLVADPLCSRGALVMACAEMSARGRRVSVVWRGWRPPLPGARSNV